MFESEFKKELFRIKKDPSLVAGFWAEIFTHYSEQHRYYHTLDHLDNLASALMELQNEIDDWQTMVFSIAYHDIIYDPLKQDNEEKSAELAFERLTGLNLPETQKAKCRDQILATKSHSIAANKDTNYFTDADLCILGSDPMTYKAYSIAIRNEYSVYPRYTIPGAKRF
jgi:predicted metal-dependent HD superfamily phosphohydrolase